MKRALALLKGAMDVLVVGDPGSASTDVGPVIDQEARTALDNHLSKMKAQAKVLHQVDIGALVTAKHPLSEVKAAFQGVADRTELGVVITFPT